MGKSNPRGRKTVDKSKKQKVFRSKGNKKGPFKNKKKSESDKVGNKRTYCFNRYRDKNRVEEELAKKRKIEETIEEQYDKSDSEEEANPIQQLLSTFSTKEKAINNLVESSDESEVSDHDNADEEDVNLDENQLSEDEIDDSNITEDDNEMEQEIQLDETAGDACEDETIDDQELDVDTEKDDTLIDSNDPFTIHLRDDLHESILNSVSNNPQIIDTTNINWPCLGRMNIQIPKSSQNEMKQKSVKSVTVLEDIVYALPGKIPTKILTVNWNKTSVKNQIQSHIAPANKINLSRRECELSDQLTPLQKEMFSIINNYQDFYYPERSFTNAEEIRFVYCLHALNHILKTRTKILHHNARLFKKDEVPDEFRDQGLVRPKVLIIAPFKDSAYRIIKLMADILVPENSSQIMNINRFEQDFTGGELAMPKKNPKPEDYELTFSGNTDDTFRIGLSVTKKSLKLFSDFYSSDIIIASPLGLRMIVGAEGEEERDFDFLASVELLILDQAEIFLMQNWDHLLHILDHLHLQPKKTHGTDFSRLRSWAVNGWTKYYRQTLLFSSVSLPEINSLFNKKCFNYAGKIRVHNPVDAGSVRQVAVQVPQVFRRIDVKDAITALDSRFEYFIKEIIPQYKDSIMAHTMIYVPSYFDYVRIRNYFKKEDVSFVQICEYSKDAKIARARDMFFHTEAHFLLYSERFHFFRRVRVKGIRHIIFYQPPIFPHFYSELCNLMQEANQNKYGGSESNMTVTVLYTKYDLQQLSAVVGTERTAKMVQSEKNVHMFMTEE
ncbi:U3 small nucleolar RNA-associated protein 25 homolog [Arctopsyche grandis]|uniref:U3 small nucleolar RNA-associated protein 25 homolog n=1 Tax=Arctopsyche grandis TaxID=121162 RepID=UPI00406D81F3